MPSCNEALHWIQCDTCKDWIIYENSGIKGAYCPSKVSKTKFSCKYCALNEMLVKQQTELALLRTRIQSYENDHRKETTSLTNEIRECGEGLEKVKGTIGNISEPTSTRQLSAGQLRQATAEVKEVESRKMNVVVWGLPERDDDIDELVKYINGNHSGINHIHKKDIVKADRLGNNHARSKARLLKVKVKNVDIKRTLLNVHKFKNDEVKEVIFIRPDLTPAQMEVDKKLREEWLAKGKDRFTIRKGRVVPRDIPAPHSEQPTDSSNPTFTGNSGLINSTAEPSSDIGNVISDNPLNSSNSDNSSYALKSTSSDIGNDNSDNLVNSSNDQNLTTTEPDTASTMTNKLILATSNTSLSPNIVDTSDTLPVINNSLLATTNNSSGNTSFSSNGDSEASNNNLPEEISSVKSELTITASTKRAISPRGASITNSPNTIGVSYAKITKENSGTIRKTSKGTKNTSAPTIKETKITPKPPSSRLPSSRLASKQEKPKQSPNVSNLKKKSAGASSSETL